MRSPARDPGSPERRTRVISKHPQPGDTERVLDKIARMPRRSGKSGNGFDAIDVTVLDFVMTVAQSK